MTGMAAALGPWQMILAAAAVGAMGALLARRAGATVGAAIAGAAVIAWVLAWSGRLDSVGTTIAHLLLLLGLLLVVGTRIGPVEAAAGVSAAVLAGALDPHAWLVAVAVPVAALARGSARNRRFVAAAIVMVLALGALAWYSLHRNGIDAAAWPPGDVTGPASLAGVPALTAVVVGALAAGLSTRSRRAAQAGMSNPTTAPVRRPVTALVLGALAVLVAAAIGSTTAPDESTGTASASGSDSALLPSAMPVTAALEASGEPSATSGTSTGQCPTTAVPSPASEPDAVLVAAGAQLQLNPHISMCQGSVTALDAGAVDGKVLAVLAVLAEGYRFRVDTALAATAELSAVVSANDDEPAAQASAEWLRSQVEPYAPSTVEVLDDGRIRLAFES